jgi:hypothetical protein
MDITEMHLNIDLELNKLNSNLYEIILPQEKDYFLNRAQERFIKQRYGALSNSKREGFEMSQKRIDDLRNLLVPNYYDKCFRLPITDFDYASKLKFYFPGDYMFLTSSRSKMKHNHCGTLIPVDTVDTFKTITINLSILTDYALFGMKLGATAGAAQIVLPVGTLTGLDGQEKTLAIQTVVDTLNNNTNFTTPGWVAYSSNYRNVKGDIVITVPTADTNNLYYTLTGTYPGSPSTFTKVTNTKTYIVANGNEEIAPNRFAQQDDVYIMQVDPFNRTDAFEGPLTIIHTDSIDVFYRPTGSEAFIVNEIAISYLRKPRLMSSTTNQSCELSEETHAEILRDAVNLLLETMEASGRLQSSLGVEQTNE